MRRNYNCGIELAPEDGGIGRREGNTGPTGQGGSSDSTDREAGRAEG